MQVRATNRGFYLSTRQIGEVFECPDHIAKDSPWMEPVGRTAGIAAGAAPAKPSGPPAAAIPVKDPPPGRRFP